MFCVGPRTLDEENRVYGHKTFEPADSEHLADSINKYAAHRVAKDIQMRLLRIGGDYTVSGELGTSLLSTTSHDSSSACSSKLFVPSHISAS